MAVTKNHAELSVVKKNGDVDILYLKSEGRDVAINRDRNTKIPSEVQTVQDLVDKLNDLAFGNGTNLVYIGDGEVGSGNLPPLSEIDDSRLSLTSSWSSQKINDRFERFIPMHEIGEGGGQVDSVNKLYLSPVTFAINTQQFTALKSLTPEPTTDAEWLVKYYPITMDRYAVEGAPGAPNTPRTACQEWLKVSDTTGKAIDHNLYIRVYSGNQWQVFKKK